MTEKILVPVLGESITEATISKWLKSKGEKIEADKKSLGVTVFLQPKLNTFSEEDLEGYSKRIIENVSSKLGGYLRD